MELELDSSVGRLNPVHKSLSNTFRMHQKLNDSNEDSSSSRKRHQKRP